MTRLAATRSLDEGELQPVDPRGNPYALPNLGAAEEPFAREERSRSPQLVSALRCVQGCCEILGFATATPGMLAIVAGGISLYLLTTSQLYTAGVLVAALSAGAGSTIIALGCAIHFRQMWAVWIVLVLAWLSMAFTLIAALGTLDLLRAIPALFLILPIALCLQILRASAELSAAGVPLSAEIRQGRIR